MLHNHDEELHDSHICKSNSADHT